MDKKQQKLEAKREREKKIVAQMIALYCKRNHRDRHGENELCPECAALTEYAWRRSDLCPFMEHKTFCSNCRVHCYAPEMREQIRVVMRYAAPRMLFYHPIAAIRHLIESKREKRRLAQIEQKS